MKILFIDDDEHVRQFAAAVLERNGFEVIQANDSEEAFEIWREEEPFDLLIIDIVLPGLKGTDIARTLTAEKPELKVVFISAFVDEEFLQSTEIPPGALFLGKPFSPRTLVELIRKQV